MGLRILYFSWIKEKVGVGEETVSPPHDVTTVADLMEWLKTQSPAHAQALADSDQIRVAVDQVHSPYDLQIAGKTEIAFFPPVTGGRK